MCSLASKLRETLDRQVYETSDDHLSPKHWTIHHSQIEAEQSSSMNDHMQSSSKSDKCDQYTLLHSSLARILISDQTNRTKTKTTEHRKSLTIRTNDSLESSGRQSNLQADRRQLIERTWIGQRALQRVRTWTEQRPATVLLLLCVAGSTCLVVRNQWQTIHSRSSTTSTTEYVDTIDSNHQATTVEQLSEFDQALTVRSDCGWLVGNVEQGAFVFKVSSFCEPLQVNQFTS